MQRQKKRLKERRRMNQLGDHPVVPAVLPTHRLSLVYSQAPVVQGKVVLSNGVLYMSHWMLLKLDEALYSYHSLYIS